MLLMRRLKGQQALVALPALIFDAGYSLRKKEFFGHLFTILRLHRCHSSAKGEGKKESESRVGGSSSRAKKRA